jgi:hypothetical protein
VLAIAAAILFSSLVLAQPDRGPLHPREDAAPAVEPNPFFKSDLLRYVEDNLPVQNATQNRYEAQVYDQIILHAHRLPIDLLRRSATTRINFAHLFGDDRANYRGALVHITGRLRLLRQLDLPPTLQGLEDGVTHLYEAWIFVEEFGGNPYCVICTELPRGLEPSESIDRQVETDAFFFKRYRYAAKDGWRDAPLLIARTIQPIAQSPAGSLWTTPSAALAGVLAVVGGTVVIAGSVVWWFRRQDRIARRQVSEAMQKSTEWPPT